MSKGKARVFVPLTKVDEEQRLVYGTITQEILDKSGEVMDYETSKPLFEKWSNDIHAASGGLSKGNLRVMHGLNVAGKVTDINFDDDAKAIDVCSKVVDDAEWNKVLEGCYTGFSVGGSYAKRWTETQEGGAKVKKFTAQPNEVSLVDNPCVPSATFTMVKADGAEEAIEFKVENDDEAWPDFAKADTGDKADEASPAQGELPLPSNDQVVEKATELAKAANDGTTWMDHVVAARDELMKNSPLSMAVEQAREGKEAREDGKTGEEAKEEVDANEGTGEAEAVDDDAAAGTIEKTTPAGVKQVWTSSDGSTFEKKADAEKHEASLVKTEPTEAEKLKARMAKALSPDPVENEPGLLEDFDRLSKVVSAISTPFENGQPKLEKGMYTVNRFSNVLSDMASLSRTIKAEGKREGDDASDSTVSADIIGAVKTLGQSFLAYATNQVTELLAGMDDDVVVECYDYYYRAAQDDTENALAKDVTSIINDFREPAAERRETLAKAFGITDVPVETDELSPVLQKRFEAIERDRDDFKKIAEDAVGQIETLTKRVDDIANTPMPRAPRDSNIAHKEGDQFFGKAATTEADKVMILKEMIETHGADAMATMMIKAAHAQGGQQLSLKQG